MVTTVIYRIFTSYTKEACGIQKKIPKNCSNIHRYFIKTHGITVLSYNYLIFSHHNACNRQLTGLKRYVFICMYAYVVRPL